jgi:hypothetical protein
MRGRRVACGVNSPLQLLGSDGAVALDPIDGIVLANVSARGDRRVDDDDQVVVVGRVRKLSDGQWALLLVSSTGGADGCAGRQSDTCMLASEYKLASKRVAAFLHRCVPTLLGLATCTPYVIIPLWVVIKNASAGVESSRRRAYSSGYGHALHLHTCRSVGDNRRHVTPTLAVLARGKQQSKAPWYGLAR